MDPRIPLCGRETRSAFSYEYSYSSLIFVEYSSIATAILSALIFHAPLVRDISFLMLYSLASLLNTWRVLFK